MRTANLASIALLLLVLQLQPVRACQTVAPEFAEFLASQWISAFRRGHYEALQSLYAEDTVVSPFGGRETIGTAPQVRHYLQGFVMSFEPIADPETTLRIGCNTILDFGTMKLKPRGGPMRSALELRYARVYERRNRHWIIAYETASEWRPLGQAPGAPAVTMEDRRPLRAARPRPAMSLNEAGHGLPAW